MSAPDPASEGCLLVEVSSSALAALPRAERVRSVEDLRARLDAADGPRTVVLGPDLDLPAVASVMVRYRTRSGIAFVLERRHVREAELVEARAAGLREVVVVGDLGALTAAVVRSRDTSPAREERPRFGLGLGRARIPAAGTAGQDPRRRRGRVVTVLSGKGGCGRTTFGVNLAAALAAGGRRSVVLVDLGPGDVAVALRLEPTSTLADVAALGTEGLDAERVRGMLTTHSPGLSALPAPAGTMTTASVPPAVVGRVLELLAGVVDHVVVDTPTTLDAHVLAALDVSDTAVLLTSPETTALEHLRRTLSTLDLLGHPHQAWPVVLNRSDSQVGMTPRQVEALLGRQVSGFLPSSRDVPASVNSGTPLVVRAPWHPVSLAVREFAEREVARPAPVVDLRDRRGGPRGAATRPLQGAVRAGSGGGRLPRGGPASH